MFKAALAVAALCAFHVSYARAGDANVENFGQQTLIFTSADMQSPSIPEFSNPPQKQNDFTGNDQKFHRLPSETDMPEGSNQLPEYKDEGKIGFSDKDVRYNQ